MNPAEAGTDATRVGVAVPAAGVGRRMGGVQKPLLALRGEPVLLWALRPFLRLPQVTAIAVALHPDAVDDPPAWLLAEDERIRVVAGGETRRDSVWHAMQALPDTLDVVAVHDAARPLVSTATIERCLAAVGAGIGAVAGMRAADTVKRVDDDDFVVETPDRSRLWQAQTPQVFRRDELFEAYRQAQAQDWPATDDAGVFERHGGRVRMVESTGPNMKLTRPDDVALIESLLPGMVS